jgi:hypothetical protein
MSEIIEDLKISNIEVASNLGVRLTGSNPQIKSTTANATLNITADGDVDITSSSAGININSQGAIELVSTVSGVSVATAGTQKIGFYGATPIVRPTGTGLTGLAGVGSSSTHVLLYTTFDGDLGSTAYAIGDIVKALKQLGLIAQ